MLSGIDISCDQNEIDFHALKASGDVDWVHAKATEGITYADAHFAGYHDQAKAAGVPFGAYHFLHAGDDGAAQARAFLAAIDGREGDVVPMVDVEGASVDGQTPAKLIAELGKFLEVVDASLPAGKRTLIYFEYSLWVNFLGGYDGFSGHPAWPAAYNTDETLDMTGTGWTTWTVWQHSDGTGLPPIPGISTTVDRDRLNADSLEVILR